MIVKGAELFVSDPLKGSCPARREDEVGGRSLVLYLEAGYSTNTQRFVLLWTQLVLAHRNQVSKFQEFLPDHC